MAYREPSLETVELLPAHVAAVSNDPLWRRLDEGGGGHLGLRDEEPFFLQFFKHLVYRLVACPAPKRSLPFSYQLQRLVYCLVTATDL